MSATATTMLCKFIDSLFEPDDIVELRLIRKSPKDTKQKWRKASAVPTTNIASIKKLNQQGYNVYCGINPRKSVGGSKNNDVLLARSLFADFDDDNIQLDEVRRRIDEADLPVPTLIVNSGHGYHTYWRLDEPLNDLSAFSEYQRGLIQALSTDRTVKDAARVMRIPGFVNVKGESIACDIVECVPARKYSLTEFTKAEQITRTLPRTISNGQVDITEHENAITYLSQLKPNRADNHEDWIKVGMALHSVDPSDEMLAHWDKWSQTSSKWEDGTCAQRWASFNVQGNGSAITIASLHKMANEDSADPHINLKGETTVTKEPVTHARLAKFAMTDLGNSERLVARHGKDIRYSSSLGWLVWDGRRWKRDDTGEVVRCAKNTVRNIYKEAASIVDPDKRKALSVWAFSSESSSRIRNMIDGAKTESPVVVTPDQLDQDDFMFNVKNGTIDLCTGECKPHNRDDLITKLAPVEYKQNAACQIFDKFVKETVSESKDKSLYLQQTLGMCLTGDIREQLLWIMWGDGSNGKSTLLDQIMGLMGDYAGEAAPDLLVSVKHKGHPTDIADLYGKRLIIASETERNEQLRVQFVKRLTGDAQLKGRFLYKDFFEFRRTCKVILVTNNKPGISEQTNAIWRRLRLIPFSNVVAGEDQDKLLPEKLQVERSGILNWLIEGCLSWLQNGFATPDEVLLATDEYRAESNWVKRFAEECLIFDSVFWTASSKLADILSDWSKEEGIEGDLPRLREYLRQNGCTQRKGIHKQRGWHGVGVESSLEVRD